VYKKTKGVLVPFVSCFFPHEKHNWYTVAMVPDEVVDCIDQHFPTRPGECYRILAARDTLVVVQWTDRLDYTDDQLVLLAQSYTRTTQTKVRATSFLICHDHNYISREPRFRGGQEDDLLPQCKPRPVTRPHRQAWSWDSQWLYVRDEGQISVVADNAIWECGIRFWDKHKNALLRNVHWWLRGLVGGEPGKRLNHWKWVHECLMEQLIVVMPSCQAALNLVWSYVDIFAQWDHDCVAHGLASLYVEPVSVLPPGQRAFAVPIAMENSVSSSATPNVPTPLPTPLASVFPGAGTPSVPSPAEYEEYEL
jgi:hypothetical protein